MTKIVTYLFSNRKKFYAYMFVFRINQSKRSFYE